MPETSSQIIKIIIIQSFNLFLPVSQLKEMCIWVVVVVFFFLKNIYLVKNGAYLMFE